MIKVIEATHSDGDGFVLIRITPIGGSETILNLTKNQALSFLAELAMATSDEFGKWNSYNSGSIR